MTVLGETLKGEVNPFRRTVDTYLYTLKDIPNWNHTGSSVNHRYTNAGDLGKNPGTYNGMVSFVDYVEGICMGYKFFETAAEEGLIDYGKTVQHPFCGCLSYTTFSQQNTALEQVTVPLENRAFYDCGKVKATSGGYVLEAGEYVPSVRSDAYTVLDSKAFSVAADISCSAGQGSDREPAVNRFDGSAPDHLVLSRSDHFANYAADVAPSAGSGYGTTVKSYPGETLSEQAANALKDICGSSQETLDKVYEILVEKYE